MKITVLGIICASLSLSSLAFSCPCKGGKGKDGDQGQIVMECGGGDHGEGDEAGEE